MGEVGVGLTRVREGDGSWSLPEAAAELAVGHDLYERGRAEEAEARAAVAEAEAQRCRGAELEACQWPLKSAHFWPLKSAHFSRAPAEGAKRPERGLAMGPGRPS